MTFLQRIPNKISHTKEQSCCSPRQGRDKIDQRQHELTNKQQSVCQVLGLFDKNKNKKLE